MTEKQKKFVAKHFHNVLATGAQHLDKLCYSADCTQIKKRKIDNLFLLRAMQFYIY